MIRPFSFPTEPMAAMQLVAAAHDESQQAFIRLVTGPSDLASRIELHHTYRVETSRLLQLQRTHNESGLAPLRWDVALVAQPLVQQALIEADLVEAAGRQADAASLRQWAVQVATSELPALALSRIRLSLVNQHAAEGRFNEALAEFDELRRLFADAGDITQAVQAALDETVLLEWLGDYDRALETLLTARALHDSQMQPDVASGAQAAPAIDAARAALMQALGYTGDAGLAGAELVRRAAVERASVELLEHEARVHKARGDYDLAAALWERVLPQYVSLGGAAGIEYQLASVDRLRGRPSEARRRIERIEPEFAHGLLSGKVAGLRLLQSWVAFDLGEAESALRLASEGLDELEAHPDEDLTWRLQWRRAAALRALGRSTEALEAYTAATAAIDSLRKAPLGYRLDSTALSAKLPVFEEAIALAAEQGDGANCLRLIELVKARALSSALSVPSPARGPRSDLETEFDTVCQRLDVLEYRALTGVADGADVQRQREDLLDRRMALMEAIRLRDPRWRGLTTPPPFDVVALADTLRKRHQAAITLYVLGSTVLSVVIVDGRFEIGQQPFDARSKALLDKYTANLMLREPNYELSDPANLPLDASLFVPAHLLGRAVTATSVLIAPHGELHLLPWASMPFEGARLFERAAVGQIPNMTCAIALDAEPSPAPRVALAGVATYAGLPDLGDLPFVDREIRAVASIYKRRLVAPPLVNEEATELAVRTLAAREDADAAILHLACHGTFSVADPLDSGLLFADGKIDAAEWAQMRLHYDEVVLSACSTGWRPATIGRIKLHGDDVLGLPGALLEAGARSIVVSIPKADDRGTAAFMIAYHRNRAAGASPLAAFCSTQRDMLASGFEPYTWSGLVCYGVR